MIPEQINASQAYDAVARSYDGDYVYRGARVEDAFIQSLLAPMLVDPILDIATATGLLFDWFPGVCGAGYDISRGMIDIAKEKHIYRSMFVADARTYELKWSATTVTSLFGGLSYLSPAEAVSCVYRSLRSGGRFFVMLYADRHEGSRSLLKRDLDVERWTYNQQAARAAFGLVFKDVQVRSAFCLPRVSLRVTGLESRWLTRWAPWLARYQIVTGRKP